MLIKSYAKINLFLHILGKREDGYHELESFFYFPNIYDEIEVIESASKIDLIIEGRFSTKLQEEDKSDNLILKSYDLLRSKFPDQIPSDLSFKLVKNLPVASGIGGGSANAASVIKFLIERYKVKISEQKIIQLCLEIGADVPACYYSKPCFVSGVGEEIDLLSGEFPSLNVVLLNPLKPISTAEIFKKGFKNFTTSVKGSVKQTCCSDRFMDFLKFTKNDLSNNAIEVCLELKDILISIRSQDGCLISSVSGSGATCFGIFKDEILLKKAVSLLQSEYPEYWISSSHTKAS